MRLFCMYAARAPGGSLLEGHFPQITEYTNSQNKNTNLPSGL